MLYNHERMYSIAIIDDEVELREGLALHFPWESVGFRVAGAYGGAEEALRELRDSPVDVVLTDIRMPFVSGLDLVRSLKEAYGPDDRTVYCLLSAHRDFDYAKAGIELGVQHYLVKPTSFPEIRELFERIRMDLDRSRVTARIEQPSANPLIRESVERMSEGIGTCTLRSLSRELGISESYLSRLFRDETGENFNAFLQRMKMERAAQLLLGSAAIRNKDVCELLGYRDTQSFCRCFKRHFGVTPSEYRKGAAR